VGGSAGPPATSFAFCRSGVGIPIPDLAAVSDSQAISSARTISDLDVRVAARHTWIGDLTFTLRHVDTGTAVTLVNRPGPAGLGCNDNDIAVVLDDAAGAGVDGACPNTETTPGLSGTFAPSAPLAVFNGETLDGTWQITVRDNAATDTGTLDEWCLLAFAP
jgi:subtilisin-like proprotein convertase family protein